METLISNFRTLELSRLSCQKKTYKELTENASASGNPLIVTLMDIMQSVVVAKKKQNLRIAERQKCKPYVCLPGLLGLAGSWTADEKVGAFFACSSTSNALSIATLTDET